MAALCVQACTCACVCAILFFLDLTLFWKSGHGGGKHTGLGDSCSTGCLPVPLRSEVVQEADLAGSEILLEERAKEMACSWESWQEDGVP